MDNNDADSLIEVSLADVTNWAFCPLRYWWEHNNALRDIVDAQNRKSGETLMRRAVMETVRGYYYLIRNKKIDPARLTLGSVLGQVWKNYLKRWDLLHLADALVSYASQRDAFERMFTRSGAIRRKDGSLYRRPSSSIVWRERFSTDGLQQLQKAIDANQERAGLAVLAVPDEEYYQAPMGLADAYAISSSIVEKLTGKLPAPETVVAVEESVYVDLLSIQLRITADLVIDLGQASGRAGRPKADEGPRQRRALQYEFFLFDEALPSVQSLERNFQLMALRQAYASGQSLDTTALRGVNVRHMRSGECQEFPFAEGLGVDVLEAAARAFVAASRAGLVVPRMAHSWEACMNCDYRGLCYADEGALAAYNPPLSAQLQASQETIGQLRGMIEMAGGKKQGAMIEIMEKAVNWMAQTPGVTPESMRWMLENLKGEME